MMITQPKVSTDALLAHLEWRYATKVFDNTKTIAPDVWSALEQALVLTPSSYGLQPWKFIVITDKELRAKLKPHSWNQAQVTDCSHYVIFASVTKFGEANIDAFLTRTVEVRGGSVDSLKGYREMMLGSLVHGPRSKQIDEWAARQAYIALGNFMTAAAVLQVDTCPMEGFVPEEYDKVLGFAEQGLTATVCCAAGYRSELDKYASLKKVRFSADKLIQRL